MVAESGNVVFNVYGEFLNRYAVLSNVITGFIFKYWSQLIMTSGLLNVRYLFTVYMYFVFIGTFELLLVRMLLHEGCKFLRILSHKSNFVFDVKCYSGDYCRHQRNL